MATAAKFVLSIPIFLAYLIPLDVDVVPIKFHQFLIRIRKSKNRQHNGLKKKDKRTIKHAMIIFVLETEVPK
jgi:hypothetical protein